MSEIRVRVETPVNPTEDPGKVSRALRNLFPNANLITTRVDERRSKLEATMSRLEDLDKLRSLLRQQAIRDAARKILFHSLSGSMIVVHLNKQAAFAEKVSFCDRYDESPLGPITLTITCEKPEEVVDWVAPSSCGRQRSES